jgi:hypothetical protein
LITRLPIRKKLIFDLQSERCVLLFVLLNLYVFMSTPVILYLVDMCTKCVFISHDHHLTSVHSILQSFLQNMTTTCYNNFSDWLNYKLNLLRNHYLNQNFTRMIDMYEWSSKQNYILYFFIHGLTVYTLSIWTPKYMVPVRLEYKHIFFSDTTWSVNGRMHFKNNLLVVLNKRRFFLMFWCNNIQYDDL